MAFTVTANTSTGFSVEIGAAPTAARHLAHMLATASVALLGAFAPEPAKSSPQHSLVAYRAAQAAASSSGATSIGSYAPIFVSSDSVLRGDTHSARLLHFRSPAAAQPSNAIGLAVTAPPVIVTADAVLPRLSHESRLHMFGRSASAPKRHLVSHAVIRLTDEWAHLRPDHDLNRYRRAFQTVGQPWRVIHQKTSQSPAVADEHASPASHSLFSLRQAQQQQSSRALQFVTRSPQQVAQDDVDVRRADHAVLHRFRTPYQTVGQPWAMLHQKAPRLRLEAEEIAPARSVVARQVAAAQGGGQPWSMLWPKGGQHPSLAEAQFSGFASTVGVVSQEVTEPPAAPQTQPWQILYRAAPRPFVDEEVGRPPAHAFPHRGSAAAQSGQSWLMLWPRGGLHPAITEPQFAGAVSTAVAVFQESQDPPVAPDSQPWLMYWPRSGQHPALAEAQFAGVIDTVALVSQEGTAPAQPDDSIGGFGSGYVTLNEPQWIPEWRLPAPHSLYPFRQIQAEVQPGQPWSLLWPSSKLNPALHVEPFVAVLGTAQLVSQQLSQPAVGTPDSVGVFGAEFVTLNEPAWQEPWRAPATHSIQPFRQIAVVVPDSVGGFGEEFVHLNDAPWQPEWRLPGQHSLLAHRQFAPPPLPAQTFAITSWRSQTMRVDFERDFRVPKYSLYPFRVGLYVPPISYPAQGVGGFIVNMGTFMRR